MPKKSVNSDREKAQDFCDVTRHQYIENYYGYVCENCGLFIPYGCEPWLPDDPDECPEAYWFFGDEA